MRDNVTLIGMPGAGKSTVGVLLAKRLGYSFLDTDLVIQEREGALLQELVDGLGTEAFLDLEADVLCQVNCRRTVIAPGGSAVCRERSMARLRELGPVVYLSLTPEELERRLYNLTTRGIALAPGQTLADLYAYRTPLYEKYADHTVRVEGGQPIEETVRRVAEVLGR